jgi:hypothetical protein
LLQVKNKTVFLNDHITMIIDRRNKGMNMNKVSFKPAGLLIIVAVLLSACASNTKFPDFKRKLMGGQNSDVIVHELGTDKQQKLQNLGNITVVDAARVTESERQNAVAKPVGRPDRDLGTTIASLGLLGKTGFWLETPLVEAEADGRVVYLQNGTAINLRLIPNGGAAGSGSQISVAAMQILGISIVDLAELRVFIR